jgi:putative membrane protein
MNNDPYHRFKHEELVVRDLLAVDRTELANERTLLSWVRTALALLLSGASCIHFLDSRVSTLGGVALIVIGFGAIAVGIARWARLQRMISRIKHGEIGMDERADGTKPEAEAAGA